ncbi:hypothetical protein SAMN05443428_11528 [Caloramator quimbayensis]|uniref:Uncharacterized protein n=2 Tax=Caloramator quimbayensis TaxID=1147123 RepID=A0A1T4XXN4_9CLOT|nr:hypothetical protein SAMN05443428_11528 [Caloramator quimbayensis]
MYLILRVFDFSSLFNNSLKLYRSCYDDIIKRFPEIKNCKVWDIKKMIMYVISSSFMMSDNIVFYRLNNLVVDNNSITVEYSEDSSVNSNILDKDFDRALYGYLINKGKISKGKFIPTFVLIDEDGYNDVLARVNSLSNKTCCTAEELKRKND